jgi:uncharacterized membrane protein
MGFSTLESIVIVLVSLIFGFFEIIILDFNITNIYLFTHKNWMVGINMGGAVIPIILSIYLTYKKKISLKSILLGIVIVAAFTFLITRADVTKGIVASFPYYLIPAFSASIISIIIYWKQFKKAAPLAYISGTIGVLIGADMFRLPELLRLSHELTSPKNAIIGGANVFDMVYITGLIAVIVDGIIMFKQRSKEGIN